MRNASLALLIVLGLARPAAAQDAPTLSFPADCAIGADCWILGFVDLDPGDGYTDHACGPRTYAGHEGTDIALTDAFDMDREVAVRAAAAGVVLGIRDGEPDNRMDQETAFAPGKECGNGVRVDHGQGWVTQYCHLMRGSVPVRAGDRVGSGAVLGAIGNSGASETPHLHFRLERDGEVLDPFTGGAVGGVVGGAVGGSAACGQGSPLWSDQALSAFGDYQPSFIRTAGFGTGPTTLREVQGRPAPARLRRDVDALTFHAVVYGAPEGAVLTLEIIAPDGRKVVDNAVVMDSRKARYFAFVGRRVPDQGWPPGAYRGIARFDHGDDRTVRIATVILE